MKTLLKLMIFMMMAVLCTAGIAAASGSKGPVWLEIIDGDTAFMVDRSNDMAYWVLDDCRREIPLQSLLSQKGGEGPLLSKPLTDKVTLGRQQVVLEQQFKFNLDTAPIGVEVYSSVRQSWLPVEVRPYPQCPVDAQCRARMELPICS